MGLVFRADEKNSYAGNFLGLLRPGWKAKGKEQGSYSDLNDCVTQSHLITLSARASTFGGIVNPICLAVFRLITSSKFLACSTGISVGVVPLRTLSIRTAARRKAAGKLGPYDISPPDSTQSLFSNIAGSRFSARKSILRFR